MPAPASGRAPSKDRAVDKTSKSTQPTKAPATSSSSSKQPAPSSTKAGKQPVRDDSTASSSSSSAKLAVCSKPAAATSTSSGARPTTAQMEAYMESYPQLKADGKLKHVYRVPEEDYPFGELGSPSDPFGPEGTSEGSWAEVYVPPAPRDEGEDSPCPDSPPRGPPPVRPTTNQVADSSDVDPLPSCSGPTRSSTTQTTQSQPRASTPKPTERSQASRENTVDGRSGSSQKTGKGVPGKQRR